MRVAIIGGGISGLSAAFYLRGSGAEVTLIEKRPRLGGIIETSVREGCVLEHGPDSFLAAKPWAMDLIAQLGLASEVIGSNDSQRITYIVRKGRLVPMPAGLTMMAPTRILPMLRSRLLSFETKLQMGLEWFRHPMSQPSDRSVAEFVADHYGQEAVDYLAEPLLAGVYGGDATQLSARSVLPRFWELEAEYGSLTRGVMTTRAKIPGGPVFRSLKGGMGQLAGALASSTEARVVHGEVETIERTGSGYRVRVASDWIVVESVILACPAYAAAALLRPIHPRLGELLDAIPYASALTISLVYRRGELSHPLNGFGFLVPKRERNHLLACTWVGTKFDHRVPDGMAVLRCFLSPDMLNEPDATLIETARCELKTLMGVTAHPVSHLIARWPRSMPQYTVGHHSRVLEIEAHLTDLPGIQLAGNALRGVGIPDCVRSGMAAAGKAI